MISVACHEPEAPEAVEPAVASARTWRPNITPVFDTRRNRGERPRRGTPPSITVPAYSRIVYRAGNVSAK